MIMSHAPSTVTTLKASFRHKLCKESMSTLPYRSLESAVTHAIQDHTRCSQGITHHLIDACFLVPGIKGVDVSNGTQISDFYDSTNATDRAGIALFNKFSQSDPSLPYKLVLHNLTALELLMYLGRKADEYTKLSERDIRMDSQAELIYADQIVGRIDSMFRDYMVKGVFPGLEKFMKLMRQGRILGIGNYFSKAEIDLVRRATSGERKDVEGQMAQKREPKSSHKEIDVRFRVDAGVIVETAEFNVSKQAGLLTTRLDKSMLGKTEEDQKRNASIIRSPFCSLVLITAMERAISESTDDGDRSSKKVSEYIDSYLEILLERTFIIAERTRGVADLASMPRPLKNEMAEFENTKIAELFQSGGKEADVDHVEVRSHELRDKFKNAGEVIDGAARGIVEKHPELLSTELLVDYDLDQHPLILSLRRRLRMD